MAQDHLEGVLIWASISSSFRRTSSSFRRAASRLADRSNAPPLGSDLSNSERYALASPEISASLFDRIDEETWEQLEEALILADVGAPTTAEVVERLEREVESGAVPADGEAVRDRRG